MSSAFTLGEIQVALSPLERFQEFLQSRGKRMTRQKRSIVEQVYRQHDHFDADGLFALLQGDGGGEVSRASVYRTLAELVEAGLLRKMTLNDRQVYEHDYGYPRHDHLHCQRCNKLIEFHSGELESIRDAVAREHRFRVTGHRLIISGICSDCAGPRRPQRRLDLV